MVPCAPERGLVWGRLDQEKVLETLNHGAHQDPQATANPLLAPPWGWAPLPRVTPSAFSVLGWPWRFEGRIVSPSTPRAPCQRSLVSTQLWGTDRASHTGRRQCWPRGG